MKPHFRHNGSSNEGNNSASPQQHQRVESVGALAVVALILGGLFPSVSYAAGINTSPSAESSQSLDRAQSEDRTITAVQSVTEEMIQADVGESTEVANPSVDQPLSTATADSPGKPIASVSSGAGEKEVFVRSLQDSIGALFQALAQLHPGG